MVGCALSCEENDPHHIFPKGDKFKCTIYDDWFGGCNNTHTEQNGYVLITDWSTGSGHYKCGGAQGTWKGTWTRTKKDNNNLTYQCNYSKNPDSGVIKHITCLPNSPLVNTQYSDITRFSNETMTVTSPDVWGGIDAPTKTYVNHLQGEVLDLHCCTEGMNLNFVKQGPQNTFTMIECTRKNADGRDETTNHICGGRSDTTERNSQDKKPPRWQPIVYNDFWGQWKHNASATKTSNWTIHENMATCLQH